MSTTDGHDPEATPDRLRAPAAHLVRARFGTLVAGSTAIGIGTTVAIVPFLVLIAIAFSAGGATGTVFFVLGFSYILALSAFSTSLDHVFRTVLYRDAVGLPTDRSGFTREDLDLALSRG